jgi:ABC-type sugar transport system substrate-binding protein
MKTKKMALIGALALAFSTAAFAQAASDAAGTEAGTTAKKPKGTYLHQQNKAHKQKGASAAAAASSLGTNDKGQPQ